MPCSIAAGGGLGGFVELALREGGDGAAREVTAFLEGWHVDSDLRGSGWGRRLIAAALRWARERGMTELASGAELARMNSRRAPEHRRLGGGITVKTKQRVDNAGYGNCSSMPTRSGWPLPNSAGFAS